MGVLASGVEVIAHLTRGTGPRQWWSVRGCDTAPTLVFYRCPFCGLINTLDGGTVMADGKVAQSQTCPTPLCQVTYELVLDGWSGRAEHPPTAYMPSLCQYGNGS